MANALKVLSILFAAVTLLTSEAVGVKCSNQVSEPVCSSYKTCQWFLGACIDKATTNCRKIKDKSDCQSTSGCFFYPEPQWWIPPDYVKTHYGDFHSPQIGCDQNTMCKRLTTSYWCNAYSHCTWVDGACKTYGTLPDPNWKADCTRHKAWRYQDCIDLGPQCKYVKMNVCDDGGNNCENVLYGCRKANWCDVQKGPFLQQQCSKMSSTCMWNSAAQSCQVLPTSSPTTSSPSVSPTKKPTFKPTQSPSAAPTFRPTLSPTKKPTSQAPTFNPTVSPTPKPTRPTTLSPTLKPTPPTTLSPTLKPTTAAPTKAKCPVARGSGTIQCQAHPFAELAQTFAVPATEVDKEYYCAELCASGGAQGSFNEPVFPGCRAYTFDGTNCQLFGCYQGGQGAYNATIVAAAGISYGTPSASCYASGSLPTPAPTKTCTYTNTADPPVKVSNDRPVVDACKIYTSTMSANFVGGPRARLDWCEEGCTNIFGTACISTELYGQTQNGALAKCIYAKCNTISGTAISRSIFHADKVGTC